MDILIYRYIDLIAGQKQKQNNPQSSKVRLTDIRTSTLLSSSEGGSAKRFQCSQHFPVHLMRGANTKTTLNFWNCLHLNFSVVVRWPSFVRGKGIEKRALWPLRGGAVSYYREIPVCPRQQSCLQAETATCK